MDSAIFPPCEPIHGRYTSLVPMERDHADALYPHLGGPENAHLWACIDGGPFLDLPAWRAAMDGFCRQENALSFVVMASPGNAGASTPKPLGILSYELAVPRHRRVEIGVIFGRALQKTRAATEAFYLLLARAAELGYWRVEWKTDRLNHASIAAAVRLGFVQEGTLRCHMVVKGRRRDTVWLSLVEAEWPAAKARLEAWLDEGNFVEGKQVERLEEMGGVGDAESGQDTTDT